MFSLTGNRELENKLRKIPILITAGNGSEFVGFNQGITIKQSKKALKYWKNAFKYHTLQQMAIDFLAIFTSTVQFERGNSKAKYVITDT